MIKSLELKLEEKKQDKANLIEIIDGLRIAIEHFWRELNYIMYFLFQEKVFDFEDKDGKPYQPENWQQQCLPSFDDYITNYADLVI